MKLLLIEDEIDLQESIAQFLRSQDFNLEVVSTFGSAEEKIDLYAYDCVIVDINLPGGSGLDLIRKLKTNHAEAGIIIISAKNSLDDKLVGLDVGADDYLTKPFHLSELNARINSIIRRRGLHGANEMQYNEIRLIFDSRRILVNDQEVILTRKEYDLLLYFLMNKGRVLDKEMIVEHLWGDDMSLAADSLDFIYTHIKNLRKKLEDKGAKNYINTVYGIGYKFGEE